MSHYRANTPRFVDETVDGEALIMDMVKGTYFSCVGASTAAWLALKDGASTEDVTNALADAYGIGAEEAGADVERFVQDLLADEILVERDSPPADPTALERVGDGYEPLVLERYTDLADLILLDPVHDVTDAGWPNEPRP